MPTTQELYETVTAAYHASRLDAQPPTKQDLATKYGINYKTLCRWLKHGKPGKVGRPKALSTITEDIIEVVVRGWAMTGLPLKPAEVIHVAKKVAEIFDNRNLDLSHKWLNTFERDRKLEKKIAHTLTEKRAAVTTPAHAAQLEEEYLKCIELLGWDPKDPSYNYRLLAADEMDTFKRWDKEKEGSQVRVMTGIDLFRA